MASHFVDPAHYVAEY